MHISGTGITPFTAKVKPGFKPDTKLSIKWFQKPDGNYAATDRGPSSDYYRTEITLIRWEADINQFITELEANRTQYSNQITIGGFSDTEHIFGADVDHSGTITATVLDYSIRRQREWKSFGLTCKLQALSPSFTGSSTLPTFKWIDVGYRADAERTINKKDSYNGTFYYLDHEADAGEFRGIVTLTDTEMKNFRRYIATQRSGNFTITALNGVDYPFGPNRTSTFPLTCRLIEFRDMGMLGTNWWKAEVRFAEVI